MSHAPLAPSASHRWMHCPGSVAACAGLPNEDSSYSAEGTFAHGIAAELLLSDKDATTAIGRKDTLDVGGGQKLTFTFDKDMAAAVQVYLDVVRGLSMVRGGTISKDSVECKVRLSGKVYGTGDVVLWSEDQRWLDVVDLKMGQGVFVDVEGNSQLVIYALGAFAELGRTLQSVEGVTLHIVQPRHHGGEPHRQWTITPEQLGEWRRVIAEAELATMQKDAPLSPGGHCRFCPARSTCKALQGAALTAAQDVFPTLDPLALPVAPPLVETLTGDQIAKILRAAKTVKSWVEAVESEAFVRAKAGTVIPGYKLVQKLGHRKWIDEVDAAQAFVKLKVDPWAPRELMSPAQLEKKNKGMKGLVAQLTTRPLSGEVLAPDTDHRSALSAGDVFEIE